MHVPAAALSPRFIEATHRNGVMRLFYNTTTVFMVSALLAPIVATMSSTALAQPWSSLFSREAPLEDLVANVKSSVFKLEVLDRAGATVGLGTGFLIAT